MCDLFDYWSPAYNAEQLAVRAGNRAGPRRPPKRSGIGIGGCSEQRPASSKAAVLQEQSPPLAPMKFVHIEETGSHETIFFTLEGEILGAAQDATDELFAGSQSEAQRIMELASRVFE